MNNVFVYCELEGTTVADVSLELLTKGRVLADRLGVKLEAVVIGDKLDNIEEQIFPYGTDVVYKVEDKRLYPYTSNPHASVLINLFNPELVVIGGPLAEVSDYLMLPIRTALNKYSLRLVTRDTTLRISTLGETAGVLGAALLTRNRMLGIL